MESESLVKWNASGRELANGATCNRVRRGQKSVVMYDPLKARAEYTHGAVRSPPPK